MTMEGIESLIDVVDNHDDSIGKQLEAFDRSDMERNQLIKKLHLENEALKEELQQKSALYAGELQARQGWQSQAENAALILQQTQLCMHSCNYVLALIDGNSCVFQETYLQQGLAGGAEAANQLYHKVEQHIRHLNAERATEWKIMVRVYVDSEAWSRKLRDAGLAHDLDLVYQFSRGFTQNQSLFDLVNVGGGNENMRLKLKELFDLSINSVQCQQILLGCQNDDLPTILQQQRKNLLSVNRITLLKPSTQKSDSSALFQMVEFPSIFRSIPLPIIALPSEGLEQQAIRNWNSGHLSSESKKSRFVFDPFSSATNGYSSTSSRSIGNGPSSSSSLSIINAHDSGLFQATADSHAAIPSRKLPYTWSPNQNIVLLNINDERVDSYLGKVDAEAAARLSERNEKHKLCNDFHLRDKCWVTNCPYSHEPRLDPQELVVLRYKGRWLVCEKGSACRVVDCWYGHMCTAKHCTRPVSCRFKDVHDVEKTAVKVWRKQNYRERQEEDLINDIII